MKRLASYFLFISAALILAEWLLTYYAIPTYILPKPTQVINYLQNHHRLLIPHSVTTASEALAGFIYANLLSFILAILITQSTVFRLTVYPLVVIIQTIPIVALSPILVTWLGTDLTAKIVTTGLVCFFPLVINMVNSLSNIDQNYLDLFRISRASKLQTLFMLKIPFAVPGIFSALKISTTLAFVGAIVAEFVGSSKGLGYIILISSYYLDSPKMFSALLFLILMSLSLFSLISAIEKIFIKRRIGYPSR